MQSDKTIRDLAALTGRHPDSLRKLARNGRLIGAYKLGGVWHVNSEEFERLRHGEAHGASSDRVTRAADIDHDCIQMDLLNDGNDGT